jgi:hypothetical protein
MSWLCSLLRVDLREHLEHVDFNVICVSYAGSYPAIGIHYKDKNYRDIAPLAEAAIDRILRGKSLAEFARFIDDSNIDWQEVAAKIMSNTV